MTKTTQVLHVQKLHFKLNRFIATDNKQFVLERFDEILLSFTREEEKVK